MDDMVERVAEALCMVEHGGVPAFKSERDKDSAVWKALWWRQALKKARAAIEAMREPTEAMIGARFHALGKGGRHEWVAMIDAALGSKGE